MIIEHVYTFDSAQEAETFYNKYHQIFHIRKPIQTQDGWQIIRFLWTPS